MADDSREPSSPLRRLLVMTFRERPKFLVDKCYEPAGIRPCAIGRRRFHVVFIGTRHDIGTGCLMANANENPANRPHVSMAADNNMAPAGMQTRSYDA
ncbi:MAG TPA: hypothetical protein VHU23_10020 [Rhizomicrobium sp.]|jgi:hypothetical protein|nr:hypothetical protein [Rhizomicrobium sp.]